jgi:hypothetical protein
MNKFPSRWRLLLAENGGGKFPRAPATYASSDGKAKIQDQGGGIGDSGAQRQGCGRTQQAVDHETAGGIHQAEHGFGVPAGSNLRESR